MVDARHHRSPNAGWPEAAFAGALGIRLSGPRLYAEGPSQDAWLNAMRMIPGPPICGGLTYRRRVLALARRRPVALWTFQTYAL
jgi:adenosylcobinamide-phosphate synthase